MRGLVLGLMVIILRGGFGFHFHVPVVVIISGEMNAWVPFAVPTSLVGEWIHSGNEWFRFPCHPVSGSFVLGSTVACMVW